MPVAVLAPRPGHEASARLSTGSGFGCVVEDDLVKVRSRRSSPGLRQVGGPLDGMPFGYTEFVDADLDAGPSWDCPDGTCVCNATP